MKWKSYIKYEMESSMRRREFLSVSAMKRSIASRLKKIRDLSGVSDSESN